MRISGVNALIPRVGLHSTLNHAVCETNYLAKSGVEIIGRLPKAVFELDRLSPSWAPGRQRAAGRAGWAQPLSLDQCR